MTRKLCLFLLSTGLVFGALPSAVLTASGPLEGVPAMTAGVTAFEGIPYAAPPVGKLRWTPPQPAASWPVVRNADRYGPACPQIYMTPSSTAFYGDYETKSEDCLYLNVWTPAKAAADGLPVLVWIHGGGFRVGSGTERLHHGDNLAAKGVVLVTFNYRLGVFGFLAHPELTQESGGNSSGNYGLMDQIAALKWVQRNIAAFGGDPKRVTIFGESAGSGSVSYLQASPMAAGLFKGAIGESGGQFSGRGVQRLADAEKNGVKFAELMKASSIADLRTRSTDELLNALPALSATGGPAIAIGPIVDGVVIPKDVYQIFAEGKQNDVPVLVGSNSDEGTTLRTRPPNLDSPDEQSELARLYPAGTEEKITADTMEWAMRTWATLETRTGTHKAFEYYFSHPQPYPTDGQFQRDLSKLKAHHASEIIYVFNNLKIRDSRNWPWKPWDWKLADTMSSYWVNFAKNGDPNGPGLPSWPAFDAANPKVINFGETVEAIPLPRKEEQSFWDKINLKPYDIKGQP